jgi:hypothetical protein
MNMGGIEITKKAPALLLILALVILIHANHQAYQTLKADNSFVSLATSSSETILFVNPPRSFTEVNNEFLINVSIANVTDLYGWEFKIKWNSTLLDARNVTEGTFLKTQSETFFVIDINNTAGYIRAACTLIGDIPGVNGSGTLATIEYYVETPGECVLDLYDTKLVNSTEQPIGHNINDGYFSSVLHDISITQVRVSPTTVFIGELVEINVSVLNEGTAQEIFNLTAYVDSTIIGLESVLLDNNASTIVTFSWDTQGFTKGDYLISAVASVVLGESDTTDNTKSAPELVKLLSPNHDVTVSKVELYKNVVGEGFVVNVTVSVKNYGDFDENFNVTTYVNETTIDTRNINLISGSNTKFTLLWNTTGFAKGNYTVSAYAWPVPNETDTSDNNFTDGWIIVTLIGDVNGDFIVDLKDVYAVAVAYGSYPGHPRWNPNLDINDDNTIDLKDYYATVLNYGKTYP